MKQKSSLINRSPSRMGAIIFGVVCVIMFGILVYASQQTQIIQSKAWYQNPIRPKGLVVPSGTEYKYVDPEDKIPLRRPSFMPEIPGVVPLDKYEDE